MKPNPPSRHPDSPSLLALLENLLGSKNAFSFAAILLLITLAAYAATRIRYGDMREPGGAIVGRDYFAFYMAGYMIDSGRTQDLYDLAAQQRWQNEFMAGINPEWKSVCLYLNPPHYAWIMSRLARLGYVPSLLAWWGFSLLAFAASALCWRSWLGRDADRPILILILALPAWFQAFAGGQNTFFTLFILSAFVALLLKQRDFFAGLILALLAYKFQYILLPAALLLYKRRWRAMLGLILGGAVTLALTVALMGSQVLGDYIHLALNLDKLMQQQGFDIYKQHSWHGFFALALGGVASPVVIRILTAVASLFTLTLLVPVWRGSWRPDSPAFPLRLAALLVATLLTSPHLFHYDMLLIALPAVLWHVAAAHSPVDELDRNTRRIFVVGFFWLAFAGPLASLLRIQFSPILMVLWLVSIARHFGNRAPDALPVPDPA